jgi:hypothetical protein
MYNYLGITRKEEISREAYAHRIKKDTALLKAVEDFVKSCRNPFMDNGADLVNLSTGAQSLLCCYKALNLECYGKRREFAG